MAKQLKRPPDLISIDKPMNKKDLPKGTKLSKDGLQGWYSKEYRNYLDKARTGGGITGKAGSRVGMIFRPMGGGMGGMFSPKNK